MLARRQRRVHDAIEAVTIAIDVTCKSSDVFRQASLGILALFLLLTFAWSVCLFIQSRRRNSVLQLENKALDIQISQDPLTPLFERREVMENRDAIQQKMQNKSAAILIVDADYLKKTNDNF